jgi:hypothetical protein
MDGERDEKAPGGRNSGGAGMRGEMRNKKQEEIIGKTASIRGNMVWRELEEAS